MLHGKKPFGQDGMNGMLGQGGGGSKLQFGEGVSEGAADFVRRCLEVNEKQRIDAFTALNHSFLNQRQSHTMMDV